MKADASILIVAFAVNLPWELAQTPLFECPMEAAIGTVPLCIAASVADAMIALAVVRVASAAARGSSLHVRNATVYLLLTTLGGAAAAMFERLCTGLHLWSYTDRMPTAFGIGAVPIVQLSLLIPLSLYLSRRFAPRRT